MEIKLIEMQNQQQKKCLTYVFLGILLMSLGSCAKVEKPDISEDNVLAGIWNVTRAVEKHFRDGTLIEQFDTNDGSDEYEFDIAKFQFTEKGRVNIGFVDNDNVISDYEVSGDKKTLSILGLTEDGTGSAVFQIRNFTSRNMELFMSEADSENQAFRYELQVFLQKVN
ncbi:hypothetical protein [Parapedobacter soli]|uniref:hypothetical protein n=1 Tax=Parapedobacter soli TaxID=416955 RepID=UPI0021C73FEF|nr:hypothetical protein [Parapedobacter soli]